MSQYGQQPPEHPAATYYPAPGYAPAAPKDLTAMGVIAFATATLTTVFSAATATVVGRAVRTGGENADEIDWSVAVYLLGSLLGGLALLASWITGAMWLHRARKNAEAFNPSFHHTRSAGWAWGGWICPIVNLWFPFQVVRDTYRAVTPMGTSRSSAGGGPSGSPPSSSTDSVARCRTTRWSTRPTPVVPRGRDLRVRHPGRRAGGLGARAAADHAEQHDRMYGGRAAA